MGKDIGPVVDGGHEQDDGPFGKRRANGLCRILAVHARHQPVNEGDAIGPSLARGVAAEPYGLSDRGRRYGIKLKFPEHTAEDVPREFIVVNNEDAFSMQRMGGEEQAAFRDGHRAELRRKDKVAAMPRRAPHMDFPAHEVHEAFADGEPQPRAAVAPGRGVVRLRERFEKVADLFGRHADARIADGEAETCFAPFVELLRDGNKDVAGLCELDGVAYEVQQDLGKPERVPFQYRWDVRADPGQQLKPLFGGAEIRNGGDLFQHLFQLEVGMFHFELARFDLGEIQNVVDNAQQGVRRCADLGEVVPLAGRELGLQRQMGHADDAVHGRTDFVAHVGEKIALGA